MTSRGRRRRATSPKGGRMGVIVRWTDDEECPPHDWSVLRARARERLSLLGVNEAELLDSVQSRTGA